ncbi:uncharacterized protein DS421_18g615130 [Arachis hypogaea]|nr:uncharacterized protein DS421_18g615130 [Arachis hypogaea]
MVRKETLVFVLFSYLFISIAFLVISTNGDNIFVKVPRPVLTNKHLFKYDESRENYNIEVNHCPCCVWSEDVPRHCVDLCC